MSVPPRPRPRPRPRVRTETPTAPGDAGASGSNASTSTSASATAKYEPATDAYDMFNRNKSDERKLRAQRAEEEAKAAGVQYISDDDPLSSPDRKRKRSEISDKVRIKGTAKWTLQVSRDQSNQPEGRATTTEIEHEIETDKASSDSEVEIIEPQGTANEKRRAKSRSPTPPPRLPYAVRQHVLNVVDTHFAPCNDSLKHSEASGNLPRASTAQPEDVKPGSVECVTIQIKWENHPYDETTKSVPSKTLTFHQHRERTLRQTFMKLAEAQNVPLSDLVVLKDWQQITQAVTPVKLIGYSTFLHLMACEENAHQVIVDERRQAAMARAVEEAQPPPEPSQGTSKETQEVDDDVRKLTISIRSAAQPQPATFRVRVTMTIALILKRYLSNNGISPKPNTRLQLDGEDLDGEKTVAAVLSDADFDEDEEDVQLDVAGL